MAWTEKLKEFWKHGAKGSVYELVHRQPILDYIAENMENGTLPEVFSLKEYDDPDAKIRFADGAKDGIALYHMGFAPLPDDIDQKIGLAVYTASMGRRAEADHLFLEMDEKNRILDFIDELQSYVLRNLSHIQEDALFSYAVDCICSSTEIPLPKVGLSLLELYGEPNDELKRLIRILGLSDEYTLFVMWNMRHWENATEELFALAKHVHGWGKVNIINEIQPTTEEIRRWLLFHGVEGWIPESESALACYLKSDADDLIRTGMTDEEFKAVGRILSALISGSSKDFSQIGDWQNVISRYLKDAENHVLDLEDYERFLYYLKYGPKCGFVDFEEQCERLLHDESCIQIVTSAVEKGEGIDLAIHLDLPYKDALMNLIEGDFQDHYSQCGYIADEEHLSKLIQIFRVKLPESAIEDRPLDELGLGKEWGTYKRLGYLLQNLYHKMPQGLDLVLKGLTAPVNCNRNMAIRILQYWVEDEQIPLEDLSPEAFAAMKRAYKKEPCEESRRNMKQLLDGMTEFDEDDAQREGIEEPERGMGEEVRIPDEIIERMLTEYIKVAMASWDAPDIYAVSLWVQDWNDNPFEPTVTLGYNTEEQVAVMAPRASDAKEARWNFAFWLQNREVVFGGGRETVGGSAELIDRWLRGSEVRLYTDEELEEMSPEEADAALETGESVTKHFVSMLVKVVQGLHDSGFIRKTFGKEIPVLIHELEYYEEIAEQNVRANGDLISEEFISFCRGE